MFNFLDVVKWANPQLPIEQQDVMVVEDADADGFIMVRHLQNNQVSKEREINLKFVGRCSSYENIKDIIARYINA